VRPRKVARGRSVPQAWVGRDERSATRVDPPPIGAAHQDANLTARWEGKGRHEMASATQGRNGTGNLRLNFYVASALESDVVGLWLIAAKDSAAKVIARNPNETMQVMR
jgi:hypothetical protein